MLLGELFKSINKNYQKICVEGISFDSKKVKKKDVFLQLKETRPQETNLLMMQSPMEHPQ